MLLDEFLKTNDRWAQAAQPQIVEAVTAALGGSDSTYTIEFKNGARATDVSGPASLPAAPKSNLTTYISPKEAFNAAYPDEIKKYCQAFLRIL